MNAIIKCGRANGRRQGGAKQIRWSVKGQKSFKQVLKVKNSQAITTRTELSWAGESVAQLV